ncbi:unnamed protein product [Prunus armeniaca]
MKSSRPTQFPCRKARESSTVSTGSNRKFPIVAPPPPPSVSVWEPNWKSRFWPVFNMKFRPVLVRIGPRGS